MISAIIVDDEQKSISTLQKIIHDYCKDVSIIGTADNITSANSLILSLKPQLVFLDVEMPYGNGFDLLNSLDEINFEVIFITAYNQYAITAFKYASIDYLLKPVNITQLQDAIARADKRIIEKTNAQNYILLKQNLQVENANEQRIILTDNNEQHLIKINDISYCIADGSYTFIHLINNKRYYASKNLKEFEDMLPTDFFFRIHYGHIVNIKHISKLQKGRTGSVIMQDGKELEIAARRKNDFLALFAK
jgi:two-component system LytT family response regulator